MVLSTVKFLFLEHTDFHIGALIVGNTRVGCAWVGCQRDQIRVEKRAKDY